MTEMSCIPSRNSDLLVMGRHDHMEDSCDLLGFLYLVFITYILKFILKFNFHYVVINFYPHVTVIMIEVNMRIRCSQKQVYI